MSDDKRFTNGLIFDVVTALEKHGYKNTDVRAMGRFVGDLLELTQTFEGTPECSESYTSERDAGPESPSSIGTGEALRFEPLPPETKR